LCLVASPPALPSMGLHSRGGASAGEDGKTGTSRRQRRRAALEPALLPFRPLLLSPRLALPSILLQSGAPEPSPSRLPSLGERRRSSLLLGPLSQVSAPLTQLAAPFRVLRPLLAVTANPTERNQTLLRVTAHCADANSKHNEATGEQWVLPSELRRQEAGSVWSHWLAFII